MSGLSDSLLETAEWLQSERQPLPPDILKFMAEKRGGKPIPATSPLRGMYQGWEKRLGTAFAKHWKNKFSELYPRLQRARKDDGVLGADWEDDYESFLIEFLEEAVTISAGAAILELNRAGYSGPKTAQEIASAYAKEHAAELAKQLTDTDRDRIKRYLSEWIESDKPFSDLTDRIESVVGSEYRAELIGSTESTRAYAVGHTQAWEEFGLITAAQADEAQGYFPQHGNCRCFPRLDPDRGIIFQTAEDELVDKDLCAELAGTVIVAI